ncbi:hypothetical protein [Prevotella koreensis]|uniref:Lipoprotein n=1 Tax=Prevotella koreensis TaxID=2490854 RepID=A0A3S0PV93_9BACT|nr:hypothetical protein [Prevotella koreensis]RUL59829.1 hypothetical protein EHV08_08700 [Prevotella koreensis]
MNKLISFISAFIVVACLASCGGNNQSQQSSDLERREAELKKREDSLRIVEQQQTEQRRKQKENTQVKQDVTPQTRTFTTNKSTFDYEEALNYCYTIGYKDGSSSKVHSNPEWSRQIDIKDFEAVWVYLYGVPTSTDEAKEAYDACFEKYMQGHNEAFYQ